MTTEDYVAKYLGLLSKLHNDQRALAPLRVSILCSQHNQSSLLDENKSTNAENHCQHCLTPWKLGNFVMKTLPNRKNKNDKIQKKRSTMLFNMVIKCLVCLNTTSSVYKKNKILNRKPIEKLPKSSTVNKSIDEKTSKTEEKVETIVNKKPKKKKRTLYAGLNPLVFKNLNKNTLKNSTMNL
ncbi:uncharacterized protein LOC100160849 [Acyrthosiphon pisum]|uniref:ACYPI002117 protein n=1 Tax=Acyrthosiphon pisum TaxID=7029 RepID=C4WW68_ACYPI|nr:uncharacterized protein LOC100160849 [Acyrthosiphon pisum]BAH72138.1 ACYPI002117 [Acyrthosiphon pisum]|eukprot:NP_001280331.1 uncharacterized protein LOC100160849 [Acyrthosiphon pisum]